MVLLSSSKPVGINGLKYPEKGIQHEAFEVEADERWCNEEQRWLIGEKVVCIRESERNVCEWERERKNGMEERERERMGWKRKKESDGILEQRER